MINTSLRNLSYNMPFSEILSSILAQEKRLKKKVFHETLGECDYRQITTDMISDFSLNPSRYSSEFHSVLLNYGVYKYPIDILRNYYSPYDNYGHLFNSFPDYYILQIFSNTYECNLVIINKFNQKIWIKPFQQSPISLVYIDKKLYPENCFWIYYIDGRFFSWCQIHDN